eukprot:2641150-Amphidinium_carterae.1
MVPPELMVSYKKAGTVQDPSDETSDTTPKLGLCACRAVAHGCPGVQKSTTRCCRKKRTEDL